MSETDPRYPIGRYQRESEFDSARRAELIAEIEAVPAAVRSAVAGLDAVGWNVAYRDDGWTIRQVVHHLADSHLNAAVRFRLALTEPTPTIKPYDERGWADLPDYAITPPEVSIVMLEALHRRWVDLLRALTEADFSRDLHHPEHQRKWTLDEMLGLYAWHGRHHVAHIHQARQRLLESSRDATASRPAPTR